MIEGLEIPGDSVEAVQVGPDASQQGATFLGQGRLLFSAFAFNSFLSSLARLLDMLSNTTLALKDGGVNYVTGTYYGPDAAMRGKLVQVLGSFAEPLASTGQARIWWQAIAELVIRYGKSPLEEMTAEFDQPGAHSLVELVGVCGQAAIPQRMITTKTGVRVNAEVGRVLPGIYRGAIGFANRLVARERSQPFAIANADEVANIALATQIAQIFRDENKKRAYIAAGVMGTFTLGAAGAAAVKMATK